MADFYNILIILKNPVSIEQFESDCIKNNRDGLNFKINFAGKASNNSKILPDNKLLHNTMEILWVPDSIKFDLQVMYSCNMSDDNRIRYVDAYCDSRQVQDILDNNDRKMLLELLWFFKKNILFCDAVIFHFHSDINDINTDEILKLYQRGDLKEENLMDGIIIT
jgi:hypothetical protein